MKRKSNYKKKKNGTFRYPKMFHIYQPQLGQVSKMDEIFLSLEKRMTQELINRGIIKSFREIKEMDRIIINEENFASIAANYSSLNTDLRLHIPFITNGVMEINTTSGTLYYHFTLNEINLEMETIRLAVKIYSFYNGEFTKVVDFEYSLSPNKNGQVVCLFTNGKHDFNFYDELINDNENKFDLSDMERTIFKNKYSDFLLCAMSKYSNEYSSRPDLLQPFTMSMVYLNNCIEKQCLENKNSKSKGKPNDNTVKLLESKTRNTVNVKKDKVIIINGIQIKKGKNSLVRTRQGNLIINRQTQVWGVVGHIRHYKNGKTVYIHPYKKGPGRNKSEPGKTIYKLKEGETQ